MKKLFSLFLLLCLLLPVGTVNADVIVEPWGDDFYDRHRNVCVREDRLYIANGFDGTVKLYKSPLDARAVETVENGTELYILTIYRGKQDNWGAVGDFETSWVRMTDVYVTYDALAFEREHRSEFVSFAESVTFSETFLIWEYPRSASFVSMDYWFSNSDGFEETFFFDHIYTDRDGLRWGYIPYMYGQSGWVCLDAPNDPDLTPVPTPAPPEPIQSKPSMERNPLLFWAGGLVLLLVIVSAALIWFAYGRKRKQKM
ncbi:MAG: hypothetical protein FWE69_00525 [Clostridiales bacterium]|nr:hypothetical protein [Clostridiales bacterium]